MLKTRCDWMAVWAAVWMGAFPAFTGTAAEGAASVGVGAGAGGGSDSSSLVVPNFRLLDLDGNTHELHRWKTERAVVLFVTSAGCPIVQQSIPALKSLKKAYEGKGVRFVMLNPRVDEDVEALGREVKEYGVDMPILMDSAQLVARTLDLRRTAEAVVIETAGWRVRYRGALDDRLGYGQQRPAATKRYLEDALDAVLGGRVVEIASSPVKGCVVAEAFPGIPDYARDVAPVLQRHCVPCHSAGNVGPFAFDRYESVRRHGATALETLLEERMPPWHADPRHGAFANDRSLSAESRAHLVSWIRAGMPRGTGADPLASTVVKPVGPWPLGEPDHVVAMPKAAQIPDTGILPYQVFRVRSPMTNDAWVRGVTIRAGNPKVVHHCLVFIRYPKALRHLEPPQDEGTAGFFAGFVPGTEPVWFPEGTAKFVPKGSDFIFQMHYTTTGKPETDRTELALYIAKDQPASELVTGAATSMDIEIPPGASAHPARSEFQFAEDSLVYEFSPHMHLRGSTFQYTAEYPDGRREVLLRVPRYDFSWQTLYRLKTPKRVPAGTRLVCTGTFDNTALNLANPDPGVTVRVGEQTTDEMFIGYFNYSKVAKVGGK